MPKVPKGRRKRAYRPKTRTGCLTCRIRRVKCDETRPACMKCTSSLRTCDGYAHVQPTTTTTTTTAPTPPSLPRSASTPTSSWSSTQLLGSATPLPVSEATPWTVLAGPAFDMLHAAAATTTTSGGIGGGPASFDFFVRRTCPQLAGFFGSSFWETHVLRAAQCEPAVRHGLIAIGALHRTLTEMRVSPGSLPPSTDNFNAGSYRDFALEQYNASIRALLVPDQGPNVCLIACVLFTCFENMRGNHAVATSHIHSGAKLLRETIQSRNNGTSGSRIGGDYVPLEILFKVFTAISPQNTATTPTSGFHLHQKFMSLITADAGPLLTFSSLEEAKDVFEYGTRMFLGQQPSELPAQTDAMGDVGDQFGMLLMSKFSLALHNFVATSTMPLTAKEQVALAVLQLHMLNGQINFSTKQQLPGHRLPDWDGIIEQVHNMLGLCEMIINSSTFREYQDQDNNNNNNNNNGGQIPSFCLDMGLVIPLWTIASECPDLSLRRRAISLLRSTSRQEGLWNSALTATAAERIMEIETTSATNQVHDDTGEGQPEASNLIYSPTLEIDERGVRLRYVSHNQPTIGGITTGNFPTTVMPLMQNNMNTEEIHKWVSL
ncbi:hypothetical protein BX600DRAFT_462995 [Xylariales sp. PMI_506]|nr:hypothetical protein BX600DRAFT_462995 [Xylariales sp. PMI_506]